MTIVELIQLMLLIAILLSVIGISNISGPKRKNRKLILDTCALIDGRIVDLVNAGFTPSQLIIPQFILHELQYLADGSDSQKRERARFGLDVVKTLQNSNNCTVTVADDNFKHIEKTDDKLVELAKKISADLYTTDYNLNKVADIEGVRVLNVNELANSVRPTVLPGEKKRVKILQKGSSKDQGVGYLEDGTMVVVDGAARMINQVIEVEISRYHQTDAGKMVFASTLNRRTKTVNKK